MYLRRSDLKLYVTFENANKISVFTECKHLGFSISLCAKCFDTQKFAVVFGTKIDFDN